MNCSSAPRILLTCSMLAFSWFVQATGLDDAGTQTATVYTPHFGVCGSYEVKTVFNTSDTCIYFGKIGVARATSVKSRRERYSGCQ